MEKEKRKAIDTKQRRKSATSHSSRPRRATVSSSTPTKRKEKIHLREVFLSGSSSSSSDPESDSDMTKDIVQDRRAASQPISIPRLKITHIKAEAVDFFSQENSPTCSVGDSVYNSPKIPQSSKDFDNVMLNIKTPDQVERITSCDNVTIYESDTDSRGSPYPMTTLSASLPARAISPSRKGKRTVHFDETTITTTADLGESAARFRMLWRKKRGLVALSCHRFGESKTITVQHEESEVVPSPQLERKERNKSIFDVCNYSSFGRYT